MQKAPLWTKDFLMLYLDLFVFWRYESAAVVSDPMCAWGGIGNCDHISHDERRQSYSAVAAWRRDGVFYAERNGGLSHRPISRHRSV